MLLASHIKVCAGGGDNQNHQTPASDGETGMGKDTTANRFADQILFRPASAHSRTYLPTKPDDHSHSTPLHSTGLSL
ncbi:unnamed protein product [Protopolystoma xenopodis]|uniref:Uncharacterized protein n=1 Tax=Protopolystoma xenopodis TaxID=117903 RepID=A0A448XP39_9PLAT|nr:unnamed protein product [Protopolystoma xenopodis]